MIYTRFNVPIYDWKVLFIKTESDNDADEYGNLLKKFKFEGFPEEQKKISDGIRGGGVCIYNGDVHKIIMTSYNPKTDYSLYESIAHECSHAADAITEKAGINDIEGEAKAYLVGYIFEQIYKFLNKK